MIFGRARAKLTLGQFGFGCLSMFLSLPRISLAVAGSVIAFWSVILPVIGLLYLLGRLP